MSKRASEKVMLRMRCCRCGRIDRFVAAASAALGFADELLSTPCPGADGRTGQCKSRDRRLELRAALPGQVNGAVHFPG